MQLSGFVGLLVIFSLFYGSIFAQTSKPQTEIKTDPEKEKAAQELEKNAFQMLDESVVEAAALKLPENRALILAMAGDIYWPKDEKRGRELFRNAINDLLLAVNTPPDKTAPVDQTVAMFGRTDIYNLRRVVLLSLAKYDAEFALESLRTTRPADIAAEMETYLAQKSVNSTTPNSPNLARSSFKIDQEIRLEQSIAAKVAEQDPQKAAQTIRESLSKGISYEVLPLITKVAEKDAELANKLLSEVFEKLLNTDLQKNRNEQYFAVNLLKIFTQPRSKNPDQKSPLAKLNPDDQRLRDLALKIADTLLASTNYNDAFSFNSALPVLEKLVPEKISQLKQKQAALKKQVPDNVRFFEPPSSFNNPDATPETLIADAAKAEPQFRGMMYRQAVERAFSTGDPEKARTLLQNQPQSKERDEAIAMIDKRLSEKQVEAGKLDEARKLINRMPDGNEKIEQIVELAVASFKLNTKESKEDANRLMEEAKQLVRDFPEDKDETDGLLKVVAGYAVIDPPRAFLLLGPVIEKANELINASATLAKYNKQTQFFRDGEIIMVNNFGSADSKFFRYARQIKLLAQADPGRTRGLIDQFRRDDLRIFVKIFIAQGILKEEMGLKGAAIFY